VTPPLASPALQFTVPPGREATEPPEARGLRRDEVRLLVARPGAVSHHRFRDLPELLAPGDLVVVNTSATMPAAVEASWRDGRRLPVHVSTVLDDGSWVVELRLPDGAGPDLSGRPGEQLTLQGALQITLLGGWPDPAAARPRLWHAAAADGTGPQAHLMRHGRPITYGYLRNSPPLSAYQTVFAAEPDSTEPDSTEMASAEMASAARPFTAELVLRLAVHGIAVASIVLHAGVSSPEKHEPPAPERFEVPPSTARLVESTRCAGARVVAVGTTVTRALESAVGSDGRVKAKRGWTSLVLGPGRPAQVVTGLVSGLHAPEASHLLLLEAVVGPALVRAAYEQAVAQRYLWHEFGDSTLLLP
jgi:S-adenosylmethionine:tRNA ribosyltransferase-isomerase